MMQIADLNPSPRELISSPLTELQERIERHSNLRFAWQLFTCSGVSLATPGGARRLLETMIAVDSCHRFLAESFDSMYDSSFEIEPLHEHASVEPGRGMCERILTAAAGGNVGAYSSHNCSATPNATAKLRAVFERLGESCSFQLLPGSRPGCEVCRDHNNHLFSTWFFGVAWDWCFLVTWPESGRAWVGCLTDTD